jgi:hypothetical protein
VVGPDGKSVRCFLGEVASQPSGTEFYRKTTGPAASRPAGDVPGLLIDSATGSRWDFQGCAVSGPAKGTCLQKVAVIKDYWFDWHLYHPRTTVYAH